MANLASSLIAKNQKGGKGPAETPTPEGTETRKERQKREAEAKKRGAQQIAMAAAYTQQCRFHLGAGCSWPDTCTKGRHDPEWKGKGTKGAGKGAGGKPSGPTGGGGKPTGTKDGGGKKGAGGKGGKNGGKQPTKGQPTMPGAIDGDTPSHASTLDASGRRNCYAFRHGKCTKGADCPDNHGPETEVMINKRKKDEKRMLEKAAKAESGASGDENPKKPGPKAKAKGKGK